MDAFKELWEQVDRERRAKIERGVEQMITDPEGRGLMIVENQFGVILSAELSKEVPTGQIVLKRQEVNLNGLVPTSREGGGGT